MPLDRILVVEDEPLFRAFMREVLGRRGLQPVIAETLAQAEALVSKDAFDLVFLDIRLPDGDGHHFLDRLATLPERPLVVMVTGYGSIESAVACMRAGAFDYLVKPFTVAQLEVVLRKADVHHQLLQVNRFLSEDRSDDEGGFDGRSPSLLRVRQLIERVAPTDATVLISGENGTGKELVARELYRRSPRRQNPFIKVNCAAISENLIESEFFGHERGAFTGATERREGRFELANQGTLLLDEVSEIPLNLQAKLLRVLQEREFERVGGNRTIKVNVRIIATSNRDLLAYVAKGDFRQDLYYRLNVFPVQMPPLRERLDDIVPLAETFLIRHARKFGVKVSVFSQPALAALLAYRWPGNVRELQNTIERAVILTEAGRPVSASALGLGLDAEQMAAGEALLAARQAQGHEAKPPESAVAPVEVVPTPVVPAAPAAPVLTIAALEKQAIRAALGQMAGNRTKAAEALGISIRTLRNKLNEYREQGDPIDAGPE